ncbi:hypothetical protein [Pontibacter cellulosilyticus]|uniref:Uncharacterized protein n=1 Tax=Pontibacter cellulosilyticus TaxID=1720253 RepID=A0A923N703_9BACT|nr:hypothetical protein [Pontibacter cellulosilyticus]MBC5993396.1 hypothetical protein [Pontibacter cellulosilyticus]
MKRTYIRMALASVCFLFAGLKLKELLQGPGNYAWQDLFKVGAFVVLGLFYIYLIWKEKSNPSS